MNGKRSKHTETRRRFRAGWIVVMLVTAGILSSVYAFAVRFNGNARAFVRLFGGWGGGNHGAAAQGVTLCRYRSRDSVGVHVKHQNGEKI